MKKEDLKPFTFYHWIEKSKKQTLEDVCFITDIDKTSSPGNYQCNAIELESISSYLINGGRYVYHFKWSDTNIEYTIREVSFDDINRKQFFDWVFDPNSALVLNIYLHYLDK